MVDLVHPQTKRPLSKNSQQACQAGEETFWQLVLEQTPSDPLSRLKDADFGRESLALLNLDSPDAAFETAEEIREASKKWPIVFYGTRCTDVVIEQALKLRSQGVLCLDQPLEILLSDLEAIAAGQVRFSQPVADRLAYDAKRGAYRMREQSPIAPMTVRQLNVLRRLARGDSVKEVARQLYLSYKTIDNYKYRMMKTLGLHDRVHLTRFAIREGLIEA